MTAHVEVEAVMVLSPGNRENQLRHAYRAICEDHRATWRGNIHLSDGESTPNFAALCEATEHNDREHGPLTA